eukprot:1146849-Pelagomonas_calceolata.AAC.2
MGASKIASFWCVHARVSCNYGAKFLRFGLRMLKSQQILITFLAPTCCNVLHSQRALQSPTYALLNKEGRQSEMRGPHKMQ